MLERGNASGGSDFYTYRYLATAGFLPGYNFPRLPLYAYVPAVGGGGAKAAYLQRARFIAIAEFGPGSLIYHEGRAFRVYKAKLPAGVRNEDGGRLATGTIYICDECGAGHEQEEPERCHACAAPMAGVHPVRNIMRIDNVETRPAERITANDEDRQRRGFEIQTIFALPRREGLIDATSAVASDDEGAILRVDYASGAKISRLNKGLRRRKEKSILGFGIDPATGRWVGGEVDEESNQAPDEPIKQRIVPIVSYYNQPDQELIDRTDPVVLRILLRLARSKAAPAKPAAEDEKSVSWLDAFKKWRLPAPHGGALTVQNRDIRFVWRDYRVAANIGPIPDDVAAAAEAIGFALIALPAEPAEAPPADLAELLGSAS